jgi:eukaryotic-like serine/threonine-protein kinase
VVFSVSILEELRRRLGSRYLIEREIGRGGMGAVYLARDVRLDRPVALKVLPSDDAGAGGLRERFLREIRLAAGFSHPNIVPVYAVEDGDDFLAYAMGFIEGESLADRVRRAGPLSTREAVRLLQDVAYALAYAHGRGVVHRDIKPDNVMLERATGRALVMDFGVARTIAAPVAADGLTRVGEIVGTPEYMSPEQATGDHVDGRSDLYSLALTAYFGLTGTAPMNGESTGKILARQLTEVLPPVASVRPDVPAPLAAAIDRCLAKDPAGRFANAEALVEALDEAQLVAPEIPLPIRLFAQEAGTMSMIVAFGAFFIYAIAPGQATDSDENLLPMIAIFGVLIARLLVTFSDARRLALAGFAPNDVHRGLAAVLAERDQRRVELRADAATRRARRRTFIAGCVLLALAPVFGLWSLSFRTLVRPGYYHVNMLGAVLVISAAIMLGISTVLLGRSPFRMPIGERLFRLVWLGPVGRVFVRLAGRGVKATSARSAVSRPTDVRSSAPVASPPPVSAPDRVSALELRVAALERWRDKARPGA